MSLFGETSQLLGDGGAGELFPEEPLAFSNGTWDDLNTMSGFAQSVTPFADTAMSGISGYADGGVNYDWKLNNDFGAVGGGLADDNSWRDQYSSNLTSSMGQGLHFQNSGLVSSDAELYASKGSPAYGIPDCSSLVNTSGLYGLLQSQDLSAGAEGVLGSMVGDTLPSGSGNPFYKRKPKLYQMGPQANPEEEARRIRAKNAKMNREKHEEAERQKRIEIRKMKQQEIPKLNLEKQKLVKNIACLEAHLMNARSASMQ